MKRKKTLKAARRLRNYCKSREYCDECTFYQCDKGCILTGSLPEEWEMPGEGKNKKGASLRPGQGYTGILDVMLN